MSVNIEVKGFNDLSVSELYDILRLRSEIFVVEQNCVYLDIDGKDKSSSHLMIKEGDVLVAYCRIIPPGISYVESSIGRVVSAAAYRSFGYGQLLMKEAIKETHKRFPGNDIRIGAQEYLKRFYASLGFQQVSDTYLEDGIPHIEMIIKWE